MRPTSPSSVAENSSVWRSRGVMRDDPVDDGLEAHVEHPVGLVEDEQLDLRRARRRARSIRSSSRPGRRDEHVRAPGLLGLVVDADAAVDGGDARPRACMTPAELVDDLRGELARRGEDEGGRPGAVRVDEVGQRHAEGERLARAGGGLDEHVVAVEHVGDDERLDRERRVEAALGERAGDGLGHAEIGERRRHWRSSFSRQWGLPRTCGWGDSTDPIRAIGAPSRNKNLMDGGSPSGHIT